MTSVAAAAAVAGLVAGAALGAPRPPVLKAGNPGGIVFAHGNGHSHGPGGGSSPDLTYHGGPVMNTGAAVTPILWGSSWNTGSLSDEKSAIDSFYKGVGDSAYLGTTTEYTSSAKTAGGKVSIGYSSDAYASAPTQRKAPSTSDVLAIVAATITNPASNGYYPVYSDQPRGHNSYCAWHSYGTIPTPNGSVVVQFAFFFNLTDDSGCTPYPYNDPHPQPAGAIVNVSGHELSETLTDPLINAWYDKSGAENADKCAWTFSPNLVPIGTDSWQIQGNWSNSSYDTHSPPTYDSGTGCIDGT